jgi:hypothetical protein
MLKLKFLQAPFLIRRYLKLIERQTLALEDIARYARFNTEGVSRTTEIFVEEDNDLTYTTDEGTYFHQLRDRSRTRPPQDDDDLAASI